MGPPEIRQRAPERAARPSRKRLDPSQSPPPGRPPGFPPGFPPGLRAGGRRAELAPPPPGFLTTGLLRGLALEAGFRADGLEPPDGLLGAGRVGVERTDGREEPDGLFGAARVGVGRTEGLDPDEGRTDPPEGRLGGRTTPVLPPEGVPVGRCTPPEGRPVAGRWTPPDGRAAPVPPPGRLGFACCAGGRRCSTGRCPARGVVGVGFARAGSGLRRMDVGDRGLAWPGWADGRRSPPAVVGGTTAVGAPRRSGGPDPAEGEAERAPAWLPRAPSLGVVRRRGGTNSGMGGAATAGSRYSVERRAGGCRVLTSGVQVSPRARSLKA